MSTVAQPPIEISNPLAPAEGGKPAGSVDAPGGSAISVLRSLRRHKFLAILVTTLVILAGLPLAWIKGKPVFSATAVIFVSPRFLANLQDSKEHDLQSDSQYHEYIQQSAKTINRFDILVEALRKVDTGNAFWLTPGEPVEHAAERLQGALDIHPVPDTYQIAVTLEGAEAAGLAEVVNSVVNTYLAKAKTEEFYASDERVKNLLEDRTRIEQDIQEKQSRRLAIAQDLGVSSFTENFVNPYDRLLVDAKEALSTARRQNIEADAQLAAYDDKQRKGGADSLNALAREEAGKDPSLTSLEANQGIRRTQLLTALSGLSPDHPGRRAAERELAELDKQHDELSLRLAESYAKTLIDKKRADAYKTSRIEQKLNLEVEQQLTQTTWFTKNYQEGMQLGIDIEQARKRIDSIQQRIDFLSLEKNAPGFVRLFSTARAPDRADRGGRRKLFGIALAAAFLMGLFAPVGVDLLDPRLHSPRDVEKTLGFPPVGWLLDQRSAGPDFAREQILRVASRIVQDHQTNGSRIFAFTSVKARGGTSTIAMETASALRRLGITALAVEANAYRADPRYRSPDARGLTFVLRGNTDIASAIVPGDAEMPDYIPIGDLSNQKNLPDIENLIEVLRASADAYSIVLIDLPPILVSVDAEFIARGADVAMLVIEAEAVTKSDLQRAAACLERIRVPAVSAVMSRVTLDAGDGFARRAREEFRTGTAPNPAGWFGRRLWK